MFTGSLPFPGEFCLQEGDERLGFDQGALILKELRNIDWGSEKAVRFRGRGIPRAISLAKRRLPTIHPLFLLEEPLLLLQVRAKALINPDDFLEGAASEVQPIRGRRAVLAAEHAGGVALPGASESSVKVEGGHGLGNTDGKSRK